MQKEVRDLYFHNGPTMSILSFYLDPILMLWLIIIMCATGILTLNTIITSIIITIPTTTTTKLIIGTIKTLLRIEQVIFDSRNCFPCTQILARLQFFSAAWLENVSLYSLYWVLSPYSQKHIRNVYHSKGLIANL